MRAFLDKFIQRTGNWGIALLIAIGSFAYGVSEKGWDYKFINADGKGYYAYLPAYFIYQDLQFNFFDNYEKKYYAPGQYTDFRIKFSEGYVDRYYIGTSVLMLPFFLIAHALTVITGGEADGYSIIYQYMILVSACFYLFWALFFIYKTLTTKYDSTAALLSCFAVGLATPVLFFSTLNPDYSHIYSFFLVSLLIYLFNALFELFSRRRLYLISFLFGLLVIVRPSNGIFILSLPFIAGNWQNLNNFFNSLWKNVQAVIISVLIFFGVVFYQLLIYYFQTGHFLVYSYAEAGFSFLDPHFWDVLFNYTSGLFVYSPILLIALLGFVYYFRKSFFLGGSLLLFLVLVTYVISSWECWWYGDTVWMRPFVDFMAFFAFLMAGAVSLVKSKFRMYLIPLIALFIIHNFIQINQFKNYIFHWGGMDKKKYWKVFLRTDPIYSGFIWTPITPVLDDSTGYTHVTEFPGDASGELGKNQSLKPFAFKNSFTTDSLRIILSLGIFPESDKLKNNNLHVTCRRKLNPDTDGFDFDINMRNLDPEKWNVIRKRINLKLKSADEEFVITIANYGKYTFRIKNLKVLQKP